MPLPRLLVVEDNADIAEGLEANLEPEGFAVDLAPDGLTALAAIRRACPDLVLLDLGLPRMDGFALLERMRADGYECPVLILSARGAEVDKVEGFRLGADDYVTKPFGTRELVARINVLLRRAASMAAATAASVATPAVVPITDDDLRTRFGLTDRQCEVARLLGDGCSNDEIAERLGISPNTARNHTEHVMKKLGTTRRARVGAQLRAIPG